MNKNMKKILSLLALIFIVLGSLFTITSFVHAQSRLRYPIAELGSCRDAKECSFYCEIPANKAACWSYGKYKLGPNVLGTTTMSPEEKQTMEKKVRQYGITFPIAELGNCKGPQECKDFCQQPANYETCTGFAKKKGFAKDTERSGEDDGIPQEKRQEIMSRARTELGCTSMETCRAVCEQDQTKCEAFAKKHGISQEPPKELQIQEQQRKVQMLKNAREDLGCTSMESCKNICEKNPERCMAFAKKHGFDRNNRQTEEARQDNGQYEGSSSGRGPAIRPPCANDESCKRYCVEHPDECPGYQGKPGFTPAGGEFRSPTGGSFGTSSSGFVGPTGCRTEEECKAYCQTNPDKCPGFKEGEEKLRKIQSDQYRQYQTVPPMGYPSYAPEASGYQRPTPSQYQQGPGAAGGNSPQSTGTQYNYQPQTNPSYAPQPSYYPQPTP